MKKTARLFAVMLVIALVAISCTQRYLFFPYPGNDGNAEEVPDNPTEPIITDPFNTGDPEILFNDNFTSQKTVTNYFYKVPNIDFNKNQVHEDGVAKLYGGAQFMMFAPEVNGIDLLKNSYTMEFTFTPAKDFSTADTTQGSYRIGAGMGSYNTDTGFIAQALDNYMIFEDSDTSGKLDVKGTDNQTVIMSIVKGEPVSVKIVFDISSYNTAAMTGTINEKEIFKETRSLTAPAQPLDAFQFSIWGPNGSAYNEPGPMAFGTLDNFTIKIEERTEPITIPASVTYPDSNYDSNQTLSNSSDVTNALKNLAEETKLTLSGGTYDMTDKTSEYNGQTGWLFYVKEDNVAIVAADGEKATIESSDTTPSGAWASQNLMTIEGDNVVLAGLNIGTRAQEEPNKSIEIFGNNAIIDSCIFEENAVLYFTENSEEVNKLTVKNCKFLNNASLTICNGVGGEITIEGNKFEEGSTLRINGSLTTGWNDKSVDLSNAIFTDNIFESGSSVIIKYDESNTNNDSIKNFDISSIADNLGTAVKADALSGNNVVGTQFTYTAN